MKKLLLSLILINLFNTYIFADTYSATSSIVLNYQIDPSYKIKIPKQIDITEKQTSFNYYVQGDIYEDQTLNVTFDSEVTLESSNATFKAYISQEKITFTNSDLTNEYIGYCVNISHDDFKAGKYVGTLNVMISLIGGNNEN